MRTWRDCSAIRVATAVAARMFRVEVATTNVGLSFANRLRHRPRIADAA